MDRHITDWFRDAGWGVFCHYLASDSGSYIDGSQLNSADWNRRIDAFDAEGLADQLNECGAGYFFLTIGQNSGFYCSPNRTYDEIVGIRPSKCSQRDLIADLAEALQKRKIRMMVYLPSSAPAADPVAVRMLGWEWGFADTEWPVFGKVKTGKRLAGFQVNWERIIGEWSQRWGRKVSGWWIDGCYWPDEMYRHNDEPNFQSFVRAMKLGNPESIVAFNLGPEFRFPLKPATEFEDYTAGHSVGNGISGSLYASAGRFIGNDQFHIAQILGEKWGFGNPTFPDDFLQAYVKYIRDREGVITFDVPISRGGLIPEAFIRQLKVLRR